MRLAPQTPSWKKFLSTLERQEPSGSEREETSLRNKSVESLKRGAKWLLGLAVLGWVIAVLYLPHANPGQQERETHVRALTQVGLALYTSLPDISPRFELRGGSNLEIYMRRPDFEGVPFPDREEFVRDVGTAWCDFVDGTYLPSVRFLDIRTGEGLGKYRCVFDWASLD